MGLLKGNIKIWLLYLLTGLYCYSLQAQKTGLVLSGGGASGIAHIGVIKALEEHNIPIDYITGTSIGAFVGGLYAIGYTPQQMEELVTSDKFFSLANGELDSKYVQYFQNKDHNASWISFKISLDSVLEPIFPTNLISPIPMDLAFMEMFAAAGASCNYNFDSLVVPFRCVASDVAEKRSIIFRDSSLSKAIRASLSYPFYLKPISIDGKLLFDGGLYNNFPSDVMYDEFFPDVILGSNVTGNVPPPKEDDILSQIKSMLMSKTNYDVICENGIIIEPKADVGLFAFDDAKTLIDSGYYATIRRIEEIKSIVDKRVTKEELTLRRKKFTNSNKEEIFDEINAIGLNSAQANYVRKTLMPGGKPVTLKKLKHEYFRLAADDRIKHIYPDAVKKENGNYTLNLYVKKEKDLITYFGGNFSNRPISTGFAGFKYNYLRNIAATVTGNTYFGKLYASAQLKTRIDFPFKFPFFVEPHITYNRWDFFKSRYVFFEDVKPPFLIHKEEFGELNIGLPAKSQGKFMAGIGYVNNRNSYYQTDQYLESDTADKTNFSFFTSSFSYEYNNLNRKQYANEGTLFRVRARYIQGEEFTEPGTTSIDRKPVRSVHEWIQVKVNFESYYKRKGTLRLGVFGEAVYSTQPFFQNYTASILVSPAFQPTPESKTIFIENYRTHKYFATGLKNVVNIRKNLEFRLNGYIALPTQSIQKDADLKAYYGGVFATKYYIGMAGLVYHTPVGPASLSVNYYDKLKNPVSIMFHFGYILFNQSAFD